MEHKTEAEKRFAEVQRINKLNTEAGRKQLLMTHQEKSANMFNYNISIINYINI